MLHVKHFETGKIMAAKSNIFKYRVVVIGGGHAGCEAALSSARRNTKTLLLTINLDSIGLMPCNSAVGGPGRGQMVREIDVLGGEISRNVDKNFVHMRMLNTSRGPAVRTLRAIVDKKRYIMSMKDLLENQDRLDLRQGLATGIKKDGSIFNVHTSDGITYECKCIVFCTGTFLRAKIFWGKNEIEAGRQGEINSKSLPASLEDLGFKFGRLKTGTPPRVDRNTVKTQDLEIQAYDERPQVFSFGKRPDGRSQIENYITYVEKDCMDYIKKNLDKSTVYGTDYKTEGPKYCPSIEDKIVRFPDRERHMVFIQPEGRKTNEMYLHGLSTTFSEEIQSGILKRIKGLEDASITRPGYGVEYDYLLPYQINQDMESKKHRGMFFAGQVNGTTGYEEAAAQGLMAGINAARNSKGLDSLIIERKDGYIGILLDDIAVKGVREPYRMLTSRNEYRLYHRHDNADQRMLKFLKKIGLKEKAGKIIEKYKRIDTAVKEIKSNNKYKNKFLNKIKKDMLSKGEAEKLKNELGLNAEELNSACIELKYEGYMKREKEKIMKINSNLDRVIPEDTDYRKVKNISNEAIKILSMRNPSTLEQASRIEGVSPADIFSIFYYLRNVSRETQYKRSSGN